MAVVLNIETSTTVCSVAISRNGKLLSLKETSDENSHASKLTIFIEQALEETKLAPADLDAIAVSSGPGSYTGLRIGYSTAKGLCYALDKPLITINTLKALAFASKEESPQAKLFCPMIDARRMEVYCTLYNDDLEEILPLEAKVLDDESFKEELENQEIIFCGNGAFKMNKVSHSPNINVKNSQCSARNMIFLSCEAYKNAIFENIAYVTPLYLKAPFITKPRKRL